MAIAASDATDRVEQLILLTDRLTELVAEQAAAFEQRQPQTAAAMHEEVSRLANLYRHESARVRGEPRMISGAPTELRTKLVQATEAFDAVLARQGRAIEAARIITEGLVKAIAEEVASQRSQATVYGSGGQQSGGASATAITLNKRA